MSGDREHRVARASSHKRLARSPSLEMLARNDGPPTSAQRTLSSLSVASVSRTRSLSTDSEDSTKGGSLVTLNHVKRPRTDEDLLLSEIIAGAVKEAAWRRRLLKEARIEVMDDVLQFCAARITTACVVFTVE